MDTVTICGAIVAWDRLCVHKSQAENHTVSCYVVADGGNDGPCARRSFTAQEIYEITVQLNTVCNKLAVDK